MRLYLLCLSILFSINLQATVYFVNQNATGVSDGSSWDNAFVDMPSAYSVSQYGDSLWIAQGTYYWPTNCASFYKAGVFYFGGFQGNESSLKEREGNGLITKIDAGLCAYSTKVTYYNYFDKIMFVSKNGGGVLINAYSPSVDFYNCSFQCYDSLKAVIDIFLPADEFDVLSVINFKNCTFSGNSSKNLVRLDKDVDGTVEVSFENCLFAGNVVENVLYHEGSNGVTYNFRNCTFSNNTCILFDSSALTWGFTPNQINIQNSIIVNSGAFENINIPYCIQNTLYDGSLPTNSCGGAANNLLLSDPLFNQNPSAGPDALWATSDDDLGNLSLKWGSPAVDAGNLSYVFSELDLAGNYRIVNGIPDLGAYETGSCSPVAQDMFEPNNTYTEAKWMPAAGILEDAFLENANDEDWYYFFGPYSKSKFFLYGLNADHRLDVYDDFMSLLGSSDQAGSSNETVILNLPFAPSLYYVKVSSNDANFVDSCHIGYRLKITQSAVPIWNEEETDQNTVSNAIISDNLLIINNVTNPVLVRLYDISGRQCLSKSISSDESIDLSRLASGIYVLELREAGAVRRKKVFR